MSEKELILNSKTESARFGTNAEVERSTSHLICKRRVIDNLGNAEDYEVLQGSTKSLLPYQTIFGQYKKTLVDIAPNNELYNTENDDQTNPICLEDILLEIIDEPVASTSHGRGLQIHIRQPKEQLLEDLITFAAENAIVFNQQQEMLDKSERAEDASETQQPAEHQSSLDKTQKSVDDDMFGIEVVIPSRLNGAQDVINIKQDALVHDSQNEGLETHQPAEDQALPEQSQEPVDDDMFGIEVVIPSRLNGEQDVINIKQDALVHDSQNEGLETHQPAEDQALLEQSQKPVDDDMFGIEVVIPSRLYGAQDVINIKQDALVHDSQNEGLETHQQAVDQPLLEQSQEPVDDDMFGIEVVIPSRLNGAQDVINIKQDALVHDSQNEGLETQQPAVDQPLLEQSQEPVEDDMFGIEVVIPSRLNGAQDVINIKQDALVHDSQNEGLETHQPAEDQALLEQSQEPVDDDMFGIEVVIPSRLNGEQDVINIKQDALVHDSQNEGLETQQPAEDQTLLEQSQEPVDDDMFGIEVVIPSRLNGEQDVINIKQDALVHDSQNEGLETQQPAEDQTLLEQSQKPVDDDMFEIELVIPSRLNGEQDVINIKQDALVHDSQNEGLETKQPAEDQTLLEQSQEPVDDDMFGIEVVIPSRLNGEQDVINIKQDALVHDSQNEGLETQQPAEDQTLLEQSQEPVDDDMFGIEVVIPSRLNGEQDVINIKQDALVHDSQNEGLETQQPAEDQTLLEQSQEPVDDDMFGIEVVIPSRLNGEQDVINIKQDALVHDSQNEGLETQQPAEDQTLLEQSQKPVDDDMFEIELVIPSRLNGEQDVINIKQDALVHDSQNEGLETKQPAEDQTLLEQSQEPVDDDMFGIEVVIPSRLNGEQDVINIKQDALVHDSQNEGLETQQPAEDQTLLEQSQEPVDDDMFGIEVVIPSRLNGEQDVINIKQDALVHDSQNEGLETQQPAEDQALLEQSQEPVDDDMFGIEVVIPSRLNGEQDVINIKQDALVHDSQNEGLETKQPAEDQTLLEQSQEPVDDDMFGIEVVIPSRLNGAQDVINIKQDALVHDSQNEGLETQQPAEDQALLEQSQEPLYDDMFGIEVVTPSRLYGAQNVINIKQDALVHDSQKEGLVTQQPAEDLALLEQSQEPVEDDLFGIEVVIPSRLNGAQDVINIKQDALVHTSQGDGLETQQPAKDQVSLDETQEPVDDDMFGIEVVIPCCRNEVPDVIKNDQDALVHDSQDRGLVIQQLGEEQMILKDSEEPDDTVGNAYSTIVRLDKLFSSLTEGLNTSKQDAEIEALREKIKSLEEAARINEGKLFVMRKRTQHRRLGEELRTRFLERKEDLEEELIRANINLRSQREKEMKLALRDELRQRFVLKFEQKEKEVNDLKKENVVVWAENLSLKNVAKEQERLCCNQVG